MSTREDCNASWLLVQGVLLKNCGNARDKAREDFSIFQQYTRQFEAELICLNTVLLLQHFVRNVPALHDVLVLVNIRYVPVTTVLPEERVLVSSMPGFSGWEPLFFWVLLHTPVCLFLIYLDLRESSHLKELGQRESRHAVQGRLFMSSKLYSSAVCWPQIKLLSCAGFIEQLWDLGKDILYIYRI